MNPGAILFNNQPDWLAHTLALSDQPCAQSEVSLSGGRLIRRNTGLLEFTPDQPSSHTALILSAGIHGNETAPIELLSKLVDDILFGNVQPRIPLLLILGNPPAMDSAQRFTDHNLNRLFNGAWNRYPDGYETRRAAELEALCHAFRQTHLGPLKHYDLHTAIRPSRREKFALYPFIEGRDIPENELHFLVEAGIGTLLLQHKGATTFSSFSSEALEAESFTLELGKVHPFGENDLGQMRSLRQALVRLIKGDYPPEVSTGTTPEVFEVVHEILNTGEGFRLHVADDVANFTEFPPGSLIWEDLTTRYRVAKVPEAIIFPNPKVPVGHRVGLLVRPRAGNRI